MTKKQRVTFRWVGLLVLLTALLYCGVLTTSSYQSRRASRLLSEIHNVNVGDTEKSVEPILKRYRSLRLDEQVGNREDYSYLVWASSWNLMDYRTRWGKLSKMFAYSRSRRTLGFPLWEVDGLISVKDHKVVAVERGIVVEGRRRWLGSYARLSAFPKESRSIYMEWDSSFAKSGVLNMHNGGGTTWNFELTPLSSESQRQAVHSMNFSCLRSARRCVSMCDLMPEAAQYFKAKPELAPRENWASECEGTNQSSQYE